MSQIYVDELIQSFVSDGNVFLKFAATTGDVDVSGTDVKVSPVTLIVPLAGFQVIAKHVGEAAAAYVDDRSSGESSSGSSIQEPSGQLQEVLGSPLPVKCADA